MVFGCCPNHLGMKTSCNSWKRKLHLVITKWMFSVLVLHLKVQCLVFKSLILHLTVTAFYFGKRCPLCCALKRKCTCLCMEQYLWSEDLCYVVFSVVPRAHCCYLLNTKSVAQLKRTFQSIVHSLNTHKQMQHKSTALNFSRDLYTWKTQIKYANIPELIL